MASISLLTVTVIGLMIELNAARSKDSDLLCPLAAKSLHYPVQLSATALNLTLTARDSMRVRKNGQAEALFHCQGFQTHETSSRWPY